VTREVAHKAMKHEPGSILPEAFPIPNFVERWAQRDVCTWTRGYGEWDLSSPPEDLALEPLLAWSEAQREHVLRAYNAQWGHVLEEGEEYDITWPPEGTLKTEGYAREGEFDQCPEHGDEADALCEECATLTQKPDFIEPAMWEWCVTAQTWVTVGENSLSLEDEDRVSIMTTRMDPRDVEYHEGDPCGSSGT